MSSKKTKDKLFIDFFKFFAFIPLIIFSLYPNNSNAVKAGLEFQWAQEDNFKQLRWFQKDNKKSARNKIFLFLRSSDRKTGLIKVNVKVPNKFISKIKEKKVSFCEVQIGGYEKSTKCLKNLPVKVELDSKNKSIDIFPLSPIPSGKEDYAIVLKVINPNRGGLYQFHSFGQSSGNIPVSFYLGSWTLNMQSQ